MDLPALFPDSGMISRDYILGGPRQHPWGHGFTRPSQSSSSGAQSGSLMHKICGYCTYALNMGDATHCGRCHSLFPEAGSKKKARICQCCQAPVEIPSTELIQCGRYDCQHYTSRQCCSLDAHNRCVCHPTAMSPTEVAIAGRTQRPWMTENDSSISSTLSRSSLTSTTVASCCTLELSSWMHDFEGWTSDNAMPGNQPPLTCLPCNLSSTEAPPGVSTDEKKVGSFRLQL